MKKFYTFIILIFPILSVYATIIPKLSIADMILIASFPIFLINFVIKNYKFTKKSGPLIIFAYYIILTLFIQILLSTNVSILSTVRYVLYLLFLILSFEYFELEFGLKTLKVITIGISIYTIIQYLTFSLFSITIPWAIKGLSIMDEKFLLIKQSEYYLTFYRPTGIFMEPTHLAQFCVVYLTYLLLYDVKQKLQLINAIIVTAAVIASGSSLGFVFIIIVWGIYFIKNQIVRSSPLKIMIMMIILFLIARFVFNIDYFERIISRMINEDGLNVAFGYRFNSISIFNREDYPFWRWFIGLGRGSEEVYLPGIFYFLYTNGIIGLMLYIWICIKAVIRYKGFGRWLVIIAFILSIGSEFVCNFGLLFYFSFVYASDKYASLINDEGSASRDYKTSVKIPLRNTIT